MSDGVRAPLAPLECTWSGLPLMADASDRTAPADTPLSVVAISVPEAEAFSAVPARLPAPVPAVDKLLEHKLGSLGSQTAADLGAKGAHQRSGMSIVFKVPSRLLRPGYCEWSASLPPHI
jgi:hypothetical protein